MYNKYIFNWGTFQKNQISSLYLDNYGDALTEIMIYVAISLVALFFNIISKKGRLAKSFVGKVYFTAFSFLVSNILGNMQTHVSS